MKKFALIAMASSKNWYSYAPLFASLDDYNLFDKYDPFLLKKRTKTYIQKITQKYDHCVFAFSFYTHEAPSIIKEVRMIKESHPPDQITFIAGGPHPSGNPFQTLQLGFDIVVKGEGEWIFPRLLECLFKNEDLGSLKGICYLNRNRFCESPPPDLLPLDQYKTYSQRFQLYPPIEITRGCPFACKYCEVTYLFGQIMRHRSIETILDIVKHYQQIFTGRRTTDIRFISPNSLAYGSNDGRSPNPEKIITLIRSIHELGKDNLRIFFSSFPSETRPEFISTSLLEQIAPFISNEQIAFGAQSGSDRVLKLIGRAHTVQDVRNATYAVIDAHFIPLIDFILGLPVERPADQYLTLDLIKELIQLKCKIRIHYFMPLAGTPYENANSVAIEPTILSELGRYAQEGSIEGNLDTQIRNSNRIQKFLRAFNTKIN
ncbi:MAG: TIGR04013 family B12-binding domain/radical SAM domain-containing protein [Promethearchaeota archaeon]|nr:MAG: TIGR04013 family B12-binding domain/radical SAM domain-containing protein [Candidatus Lokiarchaeota archaeon]